MFVEQTHRFIRQSKKERINNSIKSGFRWQLAEKVDRTQYVIELEVSFAGDVAQEFVDAPLVH